MRCVDPSAALVNTGHMQYAEKQDLGDVHERGHEQAEWMMKQATTHIKFTTWQCPIMQD